MIISAIKVVQPLGEFYLAKIKARDLLRISTSSILRYDRNGKLIGNQRPLRQERLKSIANFIRSEEMCFPTSIIVAANVNEEGLISEGKQRWEVNLVQDDVYELCIPDDRRVSSLIIDGQHRLQSFSYVPDQYKDIELVCSIFFDLPSPYQAYLFATINGNQKRVDKSLALELFGFNIDNEPKDTWSPEKLAVFFTRKFNFSQDSPLYQRIKLAPLYTQIDEKIDKTKWMLSTAAMVEGILSLISSKPQLDRDLLAMRKNNIFGNKSRKVLTHNDNSVLRSLYLTCDDERIYNILKSFFASVSNILWEKAASNSVITRTIGISVLFEILKDILKRDPNIIDFSSFINEISNIDYSNDYFQLSGIGKTRLKRVLKYKLGFIDKEELKENDLDFI